MKKMVSNNPYHWNKMEAKKRGKKGTILLVNTLGILLGEFPSQVWWL